MNELFFTTLKIFLWKHWKCYRFSWITNIFLIILPILLTWLICHVMFVALRGEQIIFDSIDTATINSYYPGSNDDFLYYTPKNDFNERLMENVRQRLEIIEERIHSFDTEHELDESFRLHRKNHDFAVIFHNSTEIGLNKLLNYTIHTRNNNFRTEQTFLNDIYQASSRESDEYISSGFLALQLAINQAFDEMVSFESSTQNRHHSPNNIEFEFEKFPTNSREQRAFLGITMVVLMLAIVYITATLFSMVLLPMVEEKESDIKEFLRIASTYSYLNNFTFFTLNVVIGCIIFSASLITAGSYSFMEHVQWHWMGILVFLYIISAIAYAYLMSVLFDTVFYAKTTGFLCFLPPFFILMHHQDKLKWLIPFFNTNLLLNGVQVFDSFGMRGLVFSGNNLFDTPTFLDNSFELFSIFETYMFLIMCTFMYTILYYYLSHVFPGKNGTPQPFYFIVLPGFWRGQRNDGTSDDVSSMENGDVPDGIAHSTVITDIAVSIRGLSKHFQEFCGRQKVAVDNLSMDIYRNQITVLLGHNGAGKTTTMSMITGIIPKTCGTISISNEQNINSYRNKIGYCPQHNVFMRYFTCRDHLLFFGGLRGLTCVDAERKTDELLVRLKLTEKANEFGKNLSGGMKRRLCLGNALIGDTKIAILDEPSSGLDPESRREFWNILLSMRKDHTILLTTHYMEEAETLADSIAIISEGKLLCHGTSLQLKRRYAGGYVLKLLMDENFIENNNKSLACIQKHIPNAMKKCYVKPTLSVQLPYEDLDRFGVMLNDLEKQMPWLGIKSISVTNSSLEEVFLKCDTREIPMIQDNTDDLDSTRSHARLNEDARYPDRTNCIYFQQFLAIFYKKLIYMKRKWPYWLLLFSFPIVTIYYSFSTINSMIADHVHSQPLNINFQQIYNPEILVHIDPTIISAHNYNATIQRQIQYENATIRYLNNPTIIQNNYDYNTDAALEHELLQIERDNITHFNEQLPAAVGIYQTNNNHLIHVKILFSGNALHSSAAALNLASNMLLKLHTGSDDYEIELKNEPLMKDKLVVTPNDLQVYLMSVPFAMVFYVLLYVMLPFHEEISEFKSLQIVSPIVYWFAYYLFDIIVHTLFCGILYGVHVYADKNDIFGTTEYILFATIYLFYGLAYIAMIYCLVPMFNTLSRLFSFLSYIFMVMYICGIFMTETQDIMEKYKFWISILLIFPDYALRHALSCVFIIYTRTQNLKLNKSPSNPTTLYIDETSSYVGTGDVLDLRRFYIYMSFVAFGCLLFVITIWEHIGRREFLLNIYVRIKNAFQCNRRRRRRTGGDEQTITAQNTRPTYERSESRIDVWKEKDDTDAVIRDNKMDDYAMVVSRLEKRFANNFYAVRGLNYTVRKGDCFGLLGMNGAGKTTTFRIMTKQLAMTNGEVYYNGEKSCNKMGNSYKSMFGYCPQIDALNEFMTAYETLKYMAMIRGIPWTKIKEETNKWLIKTDLYDYRDVMVKSYSGGTKRKLNTALAMMGDPCLVFLDEPTTGVDPTSRRFMWSCIQDCQHHNKNIMLTSHSMDECEQLCNRLAIMVAGQLKCIGAVQELKDTFGLGFVVILAIKPLVSERLIAEVKQSMIDNFNCKLREEYAGKISYVILEKDLKWSVAFSRIIELRNKYSLVIDDVSVCETSLEDIFLHIAREPSPILGDIETSEVLTMTIT